LEVADLHGLYPVLDKGAVDGLAVWEQHHPERSTLSLLDSWPPADTPISLDLVSFRIRQDVRDSCHLRGFSLNFGALSLRILPVVGR
jgi:hypothetical protein